MCPRGAGGGADGSGYGCAHFGAALGGESSIPGRVCGGGCAAGGKFFLKKWKIFLGQKELDKKSSLGRVRNFKL